MRATGAAELHQEIAHQAQRFLGPRPALDAGERDLAEVRAAHPSWNRPTSWFLRLMVRIEHYIATGSPTVTRLPEVRR